MPILKKSPVNVSPPTPRAPAPSSTGAGKPVTAPPAPPTAPASQPLAAAKGKREATPPSGPPPNDGFSSQSRARGGADQTGASGNKSFWSKMSPSNLFQPSAASQQKASVKQDAAALATAPGGFPGTNSLYHSTSSAAWEGMSKTGGLTPASMLNQQGIQRKTGEGDQFSAQSGPKDYVSFGQGPAGLGMSRAYYKQTEGSPSYSPHLYSNQQLQGEIDQSKRMLTKFNEPGKADVQLGEGVTVDKSRVEARLRHLEAEQNLRKNMPPQEKPYPMMLDLKGDNLNAKANGTGRGEVAVHGQAPFKDNLQRVFVPADKVSDMKARVDSTMGPGHNVQVMSFEGQTKHLENQTNLNGRTQSNPAHVAMRNDDNVTQGLNHNENQRKLLYEMTEDKLNKPAAT